MLEQKAYEGKADDELFMGRHDTDWNRVRSIYRADAGGDRCGAGLIKGSGNAVYYDGGRHVPVVRRYGNRQRSGDDSGNFKENPAVDTFFVSEYSGGACGK